MPMTKPTYLFFLGGHDLEMQEIAAMLAEQHIPFIDLNLTWQTAKLSAYKAHFTPTAQMVGVELEADLPLPPNYIDIDHHNLRSNEPASIVQVANLLGIELTPYRQLVAANDSGYIPAMLAMGATQEAIALVRKKDRMAQGVTEELEKQALLALQQATYINGIMVVRASASPFSPITDQIWDTPQKIIYTNHELTYYGRGINLLQQYYAGLFEEGKVYSGGGNSGFFGVKKGMLSETALEKMIAEIAEILASYEL